MISWLQIRNLCFYVASLCLAFGFGYNYYWKARPSIDHPMIDRVPSQNYLTTKKCEGNPFLLDLPQANIEQVNAYSHKGYLTWQNLNASIPHDYLKVIETEYIPWIGCKQFLYLHNQPGDGGRWVCGLPYASENCVILSLGSGNQWQFEESMTRLTNCRIQTYDCTNRTAWRPPPSIQDRVIFVPQCIYSLANLLSQFDHRLELIKMDIEQNEFVAIESLFSPWLWPFLPYQILLEVHWQAIPFERLQTFWMKLYEMGYRVVAMERNPLSNMCIELTLLLYEC